jgi:hypothetical protein
VSTAIFYGLFWIILVASVFGFLFPHTIVAFRERMGWPNTYLSGGWAYATPERTRISCALLAVVSAVAVFVGVR